EISALADRPQALFKGQISDSQWEKNIKLPVMSTAEHVIHDYHALSLSLKAHPVSFVRSALKQQNILQTVELEKCPDGTLVKVAGLVLVRQRPGTAKGVCFITLEDESGVANTVVFGNNFTQYRREILYAQLLMVEGKLQKEGQVIHVLAHKLYDLSHLFNGLGPKDQKLSQLHPLPAADENIDHPLSTKNKKTQKPIQTQLELFPKGRSFK
ncbi:MAG: OB-fold nucleic acid binding domain-containing protein, partial [Sphingobacterium sp.]